MAKTFTVPYAQTPKTFNAVATTATTLTGANSLLTTTPDNTTLLVTAGSEGAIVTKVQAIARATNTATQAMLWISPDGGTTKYLIGSVLLAALTVAGATAEIIYNFPGISEATPIKLAATDRLYFGLGVTQANGIVFYSEAMDY